MAQHEDELVCDMAEYYHIYNWRELPLRYAATLACGLCADSRVMRELNGDRVGQTTLLLAVIADRLGILAWQNTEDGHKGKNQPKSIVKQLTQEPANESVYQKFASGAEFKEAWARIVKGE